MKKKPELTKERKNTPQTTKEIHEASYEILTRFVTLDKNGGHNVWTVTFDKWHGCRCNKKTTTKEIKVEHGRFFTVKDLIKGGH